MAKYVPLTIDTSKNDNTTLGGAIKTLGSKVVNLGTKAFTGAANFFADQRSPEEKSSDAAAAASAIVGSNIGSPPGSVRLGVPTPSGTAPLVSFGSGAQPAPVIPPAAAAPTPVTPVKLGQLPTGMVPRPKTDGATAAPGKPAGGYVDETSPTPATPPADVTEQPGLPTTNYAQMENEDGVTSRIYTPDKEVKP